MSVVVVVVIVIDVAVVNPRNLPEILLTLSSWWVGHLPQETNTIPNTNNLTPAPQLLLGIMLVFYFTRI